MTTADGTRKNETVNARHRKEETVKARPRQSGATTIASEAGSAADQNPSDLWSFDDEGRRSRLQRNKKYGSGLEASAQRLLRLMMQSHCLENNVMFSAALPSDGSSCSARPRHATLRLSRVILLAVSAIAISCGRQETIVVEAAQPDVELAQPDALADLEQKLIGTTWEVSEVSGETRDGLIEFRADNRVVVNWAMKKGQGWIVVAGNQIVWGQAYRLTTFNEAMTAFESKDLNGTERLFGKLMPSNTALDLKR